VFLPYIYVASFTNKDTSMVLEIDKAIKVRIKNKQQISLIELIFEIIKYI